MPNFGLARVTVTDRGARLFSKWSSPVLDGGCRDAEGERIHPGIFTSEPGADGSARFVCAIPPSLAPKLLAPLTAHFAGDGSALVVVERRSGERRAGRERRVDAESRQPGRERRRIRNDAGRRVGERRAKLASWEAPPLPRKLAPHVASLAFYRRLERGARELEDLEAGRLVTRFQAGDRNSFADLYRLYFDRVFTYLRVALRDSHEAEDVAQHVFMRLLEALPAYEQRGIPFRAWLFTAVRNQAIKQIEKLGRIEPEDPHQLERHRRQQPDEVAETAALGWISDSDLLLFIGRLPLTQRQTLVLRYMLDLDYSQIAAILERPESDIRLLHHRGVTFLRARLSAVGRKSRGRDRAEWNRPHRNAHVLRSRRFALGEPGGGAGRFR